MQNRSTRTGRNYTAVIGLTRGLMQVTDVNECAISKPRCVGIFWFVRDGDRTSMIYDRTPIAMAEPYGDFATHPKGHYRYWETLKRRGSASLKRSGIPEAPAWFEYEEFPRGRVVYSRIGLKVILQDMRLYDHNRKRLALLSDNSTLNSHGASAYAAIREDRALIQSQASLLSQP